MNPNGTDILLHFRGLDFLRAPLEKRHRVTGLWEIPDQSALSGVGRSIKVLVTAGTTVDRALLDALPNLGLIALIGSGYETIDLQDASKRGLIVTNTPDVSSEDVADHTMAIFLALSRGVVEGDRQIREGLWVRMAPGKVRRTIKSLRAGIVGLGAIGWATARRLEPFGISISWWGPRPKPECPYPRAGSLLELAQNSDVLFVTARADASNHHLIDRTILEALGPDGLLVNISRGSILDEDALIANLGANRLGGAALDVFAAEPTPAERWRDVPNVVVTPHIGGVTDGSMRLMTDLLVKNVTCFLAGEPVLTPVPMSA